MKRKEPNPNCILCRGSGVHAPIIARPALDLMEAKHQDWNLPDKVECGCTFEWEN